MSMIQFLNGRLHDREDDENVVLRFNREQGDAVSALTRRQVASAYEAQVGGDLQSAESKYRAVLASVGESAVVSEQLEKIRRWRESGA